MNWTLNKNILRCVNDTDNCNMVIERNQIRPLTNATEPFNRVSAKIENEAKSVIGELLDRLFHIEVKLH